MSPSAFSVIFLFFLFTTLSARLWLDMRHIRHVRLHRNAVPAQCSARISLDAHHKAADYTIAKVRLNMIMLCVNAVVLLGFTLLGGLQWLYGVLLLFVGSGMTLQIGLLVAFAVIVGLIEMPSDYYRQLVLEQRFGFNRMTPGLFVLDLLKGILLGAIIGLPLVWGLLTLMGKAGNWWWLYAWVCWSGFQLLMLVLYPTVIAPLFNKFTPLADDDLRARIERLMQRTGFASKGLFVMDGSKRSSHGNAYFSGFGAAKRIVFFDTLIERLAPQEIEAVLAHELGHFKLKHIGKRMVLIFALSLGFLALLGYLK
ncbi:MAG: M48 family metallopeptidase, partial [Burkholderiaceae bacterium]|nr:M48 family metallopeptidase [Burkholderiaceae bacterium]